MPALYTYSKFDAYLQFSIAPDITIYRFQAQDTMLRGTCQLGQNRHDEAQEMKTSVTCWRNWSRLVAPCRLLSFDRSSPRMREQWAYCGLANPRASKMRHCRSEFVKCSSARITCVMPILASSTEVGGVNLVGEPGDEYAREEYTALIRGGCSFDCRLHYSRGRKRRIPST